jgi:hypothetical protein
MGQAPSVRRLLRCYVRAALGGPARQASRSRRWAVAAGILALALALALSVAACGEGSSSDANEAAGTYPVEVTGATFPTKQELGQTALLRLGLRNAGSKTIPALTVSFTIGGKQGRTSNLPFGIHDPEPELAQPDRPVWVLSAHYPKFAGSSEPGGAETSNPKTYDFGPLKPGATADVVWKLSAVKSGRYALLYAIGAGLTEASKATTAGGAKPGGSFAVRIASATPNRVVNGAGEVVNK